MTTGSLIPRVARRWRDTSVIAGALWLALGWLPTEALGQTDYHRALKRASYLLNATVPTDADFEAYTTPDAYQARVRAFLEHPNFYDVMMRYHERLLGIGLPEDYLEELKREDIDNRTTKFSQIRCEKSSGPNARYRCYWAEGNNQDTTRSCPIADEEAVSVFWYPGLVAWVCPSISRACGSDLSRCFIDYADKDEARNSELGTSEVFDSTLTVIRSLALQPAGIATAVVVENYPYTTIMQSGVTAVDGAIAHFYRQQFHFDLDRLNLPPRLLEIVDSIALTDTRFRLVNIGPSYEQAGILSTFGWLRRYEKNRTRANHLYERLLCRQFVSELPRVFPSEVSNLRELEGCSGCHATLDPLADFFLAWGEGAALYDGFGGSVVTTFAGHEGQYLSDLGRIVTEDQAFATCQVQHVWEWLIGRQFYVEEAELRAALTAYFVQTNYSLKELIYAVATHPVFLEGQRGDATVSEPLADPPLGQIPGAVEQECTETYTYAEHIAPLAAQHCTNCHVPGNQFGVSDFSSEQAWIDGGTRALGQLASGSMPPGQTGPPFVGPMFEFKEIVRCWLEDQ